MSTKKANRFNHAGKSWNEKEAYKNFLTSKIYLDRTESEPIDTNKTNESSFEEERQEPTKVKRKSKLLKFKDFIYDNWIIAIISGVIFLILGGYISMNREQGIQEQKMATVEQNIIELKSKNDQNENNFNSIKDNFNIFKAEVSKDLDYIKKELKL